MNILLIQLKRIGDLILTTPAIAALRAKFPQANLTLIVSRDGAPLLPALTGLDRTLVVKRRFGALAPYRAVWREKFDSCVDCTRNDRSALLALLSRAKKRIVSGRIKVHSPWRARIYNQFVEHGMHELHTIDYNLALLEPLGIREASRAIRLDLPELARETASSLLRQAKIDPPPEGFAGANNRFVVFHPGSARPEKFWQPQRWADIIENARSKWQLSPILTGGSSAFEQAHLAEIKSRLRQSTPKGFASPDHFGVVDLSGRTDVLTLAALIAQARLLVTVDSAPMHLAAATATPQVVLFGPTNPFHWRPLQSSALILHGRSTAPLTEFSPDLPRLPMDLISTEAVIDAMNSLLSIPGD